ncbi:hypothetical protein NQ318_023471 [Aromia moschata]|uniref:Uncharacterized protein n=1 Tax=Aromia moschata TaxID=1265417 RepID=A0AAV8YMC9_9CUCU|nr:hypothetical protein NQ318_023471 [Aromia moschata]
MEDKNRELKEVCDIIICQAKERFNFTGHLVASNLLLPEKFSEYVKKFPENYLKQTFHVYLLFFLIPRWGCFPVSTSYGYEAYLIPPPPPITLPHVQLIRPDILFINVAVRDSPRKGRRIGDGGSSLAVQRRVLKHTGDDLHFARDTKRTMHRATIASTSLPGVLPLPRRRLYGCRQQRLGGVFVWVQSGVYEGKLLNTPTMPSGDGVPTKPTKQPMGTSPQQNTTYLFYSGIDSRYSKS